MPVHERVELTKVCLTHLAHVTIVELEEAGISSTAVVVGDNTVILEHANDLGLWCVEQLNEPLGRKFNDGFQLAYDEGADYFVPVGSDNWISADLFHELPGPNEVIAHRQATIVHEDGDRLCEINVSYDGGDGIRTFPRELIARTSGRPAYDHSKRAVDASIAEHLKRAAGWSRRFRYHDVHAHQVIGWQSHDVQLNQYDDLKKTFGVRESSTPWDELASTQHLVLLDSMRDHYASRKVPS